MPIEQQELRAIASAELAPIGDKLPFVLLHMQRQPIISVKGQYNEEGQVWEEPSFCKENLLLQRTPTLTGTQTQAGRQLDIDRDQD